MKAKKIAKRVVLVVTGTISGAMTGTVINPGVGTVVGAGVGAVAGAIGNIDSKQEPDRNQLNNGGMQYLTTQRRMRQQMRNFHRK
ncbi:MAG: DUF1269 domain-containing protein [Deltaproteobacteria bacterium]|nr:DUF1269 domain-containing protein [Deltaproteobacteria bacterium]